MDDRTKKFEEMLKFVQSQYEDTKARMEKLKEEGKTGSVTYRQLMANKLRFEDMLAIYRLYDIIE